MGLKEVTAQFDLLKILENPRYRKALLVHADKKLITAICEIIYNVLHNKIQINQSAKSKLIKHRKFLRILCQKSSVSAKKKILV